MLISYALQCHSVNHSKCSESTERAKQKKGVRLIRGDNRGSRKYILTISFIFFKSIMQIFIQSCKKHIQHQISPAIYTSLLFPSLSFCHNLYVQLVSFRATLSAPLVTDCSFTFLSSLTPPGLSVTDNAFVVFMFPFLAMSSHFSPSPHPAPC